MTCKIDPDVFSSQRALLAPGRQNHWVIALERPGLAADYLSAKTAAASGNVKAKETLKLVELAIAREAISWFERNAARPNRVDAFRQLEVTGMQVGEPELIRARWVQIPIGRDILSAELPRDTLFVALNFDYFGRNDEVEWPWTARGFFFECPEDMLDGGLWGVVQPSQSVHVPTPTEEVLDNVARSIDGVSSDAGASADAIKVAFEQAKQKAREIGSSIAAGVAISLLFGGIFLLSSRPSKND